MSKENNPSIIIEALRTVYGPIVKQSTKWSPILAYGVPCIVTALLIAMISPDLSNNLFWLVLILILAPLFGYIISDWDMRLRTTIKTTQSELKLIITGNVFFQDGFPVEDAIVTVDGVDRRKETDENGWFQIEVNKQEKWTVRVRCCNQIVESIVVTKEDIQESISISLKRLPDEGHFVAQLDHNLLALLDIEKERCRDRNIGFFTPNLLFALLSSPTSPVRRIFNKVCSREGTQNIVNKLRDYRPPTPHLFSDFNWYDREDVQTASIRAKEEDRVVVDGRLLLYGVLNTKSETQKELRRLLGDKRFEHLCRLTESADQNNGTPGIEGHFTS